jgi:ADP-heptose:LPS heptosyltransferase
MKHITIIHMGAVGDLIQALPLMRAVRMKWPQARVTLVGRPERAALARLAGLADACADFDSFVRLAPAAADLVIDFLGAGTVQRSPAARVVAIEPLPPPGWTGSAAAWVLKQAGEALGLPLVPETPEITISAAVLDAARASLAAKGIGGAFAAIHPGSGSPKKNWPLDRFMEVARRLRQEGRRQVAWLAGPAEAERRTLAPLGRQEPVLADLALEQAAGVLAMADLYVGNDSGITHLAAAVRRPGLPGRCRGKPGGRATPTVALFGPTDPRPWAPRGPHVRIIRSDDGAVGCIDVERVWAEVRAITT